MFNTEASVDEFHTNRVTVGATAVRLVLEGAPKLYWGVLIRASEANTHDVAISHDSHGATNGFVLKPGKEIFIPINNAYKVWALAAAAGQTLCLLLA